MKPFDLGRAINGDKLITRNGEEVHEFKYFEKAKNTTTYPCMAVIRYNLLSYNTHGKYSNDSDNHPMDLFMQAKKMERWVNIYPGMNRAIELFKSKFEATSKQIAGCIDTIKIEWME